MQYFQANLQWVPDLTAYNWNDNPLINLSPAYRLNGSLAIQLAYDWIKNNPSKINNSKIVEELNRNENELCFSIFDEVRTGFQQCHWPGRFQIVRLGSKKYFFIFSVIYYPNIFVFKVYISMDHIPQKALRFA